MSKRTFASACLPLLAAPLLAACGVDTAASAAASATAAAAAAQQGKQQQAQIEAQIKAMQDSATKRIDAGTEQADSAPR